MCQTLYILNNETARYFLNNPISSCIVNDRDTQPQSVPAALRDVIRAITSTPISVLALVTELEHRAELPLALSPDPTRNQKLQRTLGPAPGTLGSQQVPGPCAHCSSATCRLCTVFAKGMADLKVAGGVLNATLGKSPLPVGMNRLWRLTQLGQTQHLRDQVTWHKGPLPHLSHPSLPPGPYLCTNLLLSRYARAVLSW